MSDTFEFKNLNAAEAMESPSDTTTILALDGGQVKQIPAGKFGGGSFLVTLTIDEPFTVTAADKTYAEMIAAIEGGAIPVAVIPLSAMGGVFYGSLAVNAGEVGLMFIVFMGGAEIVATCSMTDEWMLQMPE